jgi:eukaryotic-like serine/threonine-protein kinase
MRSCELRFALSEQIPQAGRIGRYELVKRLAVGGMADIWLAQEFTDRGYERTAVVKTIRGDLVDEEDLIQMLFDEARIARCLKHENIVELYDVGEQDDTHYMAMEFVFGRDLRQIRDLCLERNIQIPFEHVVTIVVAVLDALQYAYHEATYDGRLLNVIHRDVSPQNIIIGFDGRVKLLDFGIAKATAQLSRTRAGVLKGKYGYMAPEQVDLKVLDQRADLFSVGIVMWEMLTFKRLFYRKNEYDTVKAVLDCKVPFPRSIRKEIPWKLALTCFRVLQRSTRWRHKSAQHMAQALRKWPEWDDKNAHANLAEWMAELYSDELRARDANLLRVTQEPTMHRRIRDAGFELVEEPTYRGDGPWPSSPGPLGHFTVTSKVNALKNRHGIWGMVLSALEEGWGFYAVLLVLIGAAFAIGTLLASWR